MKRVEVGMSMTWLIARRNVEITAIGVPVRATIPDRE